MNKYAIIISTALVSSLIISCKNDTKTSTEKVAAETTYQPKEFDASKFEAKIDSLIAQMTLEEKIGMLHGNSMFTTGGVERLGIPELKMADGPLGVREEISRDNWSPAGWDNDFA